MINPHDQSNLKRKGLFGVYCSRRTIDHDNVVLADWRLCLEQHLKVPILTLRQEAVSVHWGMQEALEILSPILEISLFKVHPNFPKELSRESQVLKCSRNMGTSHSNQHKTGL